MKSIEQTIKKQYAKIFEFRDCPVFKKMADYYFESAAKILKKDIEIDEPYKLMIRNIQKRLFLGIGTELLLKSIFLKNKYCINSSKKNTKISFPTLLKDIKIENLDESNTETLNSLIDNLPKVINVSNECIQGLKICKVFRNKEGHVAVLKHEADKKNYRDIENAIIELYQLAFNQKLEFKISFLDGEDYVFKYNKAKPLKLTK